jgi:hypothetical protein
MPWILLLLLSFSAWSQDHSHIRTYGSNDRPAPFHADAFSRTAVGYEVVDWRIMNGKNWIGPIRNQGNCGACVAFATIATLEDQLTINSGAVWKKDAMSQEALFSCGRAKCNSGWFAIDAARTVEKIGVVDVACLPYSAGALGKAVACGNFCDNQAARTIKIKSYYAPKGALEVKEALKKGPLVTSMSVHESFDSYSGGIYKASPDERVFGGHAVEIVGYNDLERYWIIKNSWGPDWGEKGFARISYDDISGVGSQTFGFVFNEGPEGFESPFEDQYVRGSFVIKGKLSEVDITQKGQSLKKISCSGGCTVDSKTLADGEYTLETKASNGRLITRRITILNGSSSFSMQLKAPQSYDYSYPQSDRIYFNVSFSGTIFPEHLIFEVLNSNNKVVYRRDFPDVLSFNQVGMNTYVVPNGNYTAVFKQVTFNTESRPMSMKIKIKN